MGSATALPVPEEETTPYPLLSSPPVSWPAISLWFVSCTPWERKSLQSVVRTAEKIIVTSSIEDGVHRRCLNGAHNCIKDSAHIHHVLAVPPPAHWKAVSGPGSAIALCMAISCLKWWMYTGFLYIHFLIFCTVFPTNNNVYVYYNLTCTYHRYLKSVFIPLDLDLFIIYMTSRHGGKIF